MKIVSIRGAITVKENSVENILDSTKELLTEIEKQNNLDRAKVVSIIFSCTYDLDKVYPARAARDMGYIHVGLMCFNEMKVEGNLKKCIRIMIIYNSDISQEDIKHIYLRDAKVLRPDLSNNP